MNRRNALPSLYRQQSPAYFGNQAGPEHILRQMFQEMDDIFRRVRGAWDEDSQESGSELTSELGTRWPAIDVDEDDKAYRLEIELAGMKADDVDICVTPERMLRISGERRPRSEQSGEETQKASRRQGERRYGRFLRMMTLPFDADDEAIKARFEDGVLTVEIPKSDEQDRVKRIRVESSENQGKQSSQAQVGNAAKASAQHSQSPSDTKKGDMKNQKPEAGGTQQEQHRQER